MRQLGQISTDCIRRLAISTIVHVNLATSWVELRYFMSFLIVVTKKCRALRYDASFIAASYVQIT